MIASMFGIHTMTESVPILIEESRKFTRTQKKALSAAKVEAASKTRLVKIPNCKLENGRAG
ncbi:MAG: hypothetical protein EXR01_00385 [Acetobacteraceae bacterium]|nr:hypothetical protein [Acetobacteraceae bacterium]